ncbi:unnamed protein product [Porites lobata]|uniref:Uncharacterized protein n=1 Tax=Porites lobata TaxID=104759 RepID=A0ABN8NZX4_9CNID|nr:unnamed protein product [Porites lobata]
MQELEEDTRQRLTVDIRILSNKKKSSHRTARIKGFPVTETCEDFRKEVKNILPGEKFSDNFSFALWVDPSHSVMMDEVDNKEKQGNKRKHKFSKKSTCFQIFF